MPLLSQSCNYRTLYLSTIVTIRDYASKISKMCYCELNSNQIIILQICIDHTLSCMHSCKKKCMQEGAWSLYIFFQNHNYQEGTGNFIYKALILDSKWLFSNTRAISQSHTSAMYCQNYLPPR